MAGPAIPGSTGAQPVAPMAVWPLDRQHVLDKGPGPLGTVGSGQHGDRADDGDGARQRPHHLHRRALGRRRSGGELESDSGVVSPLGNAGHHIAR